LLNPNVVEKLPTVPLLEPNVNAVFVYSNLKPEFPSIDDHLENNTSVSSPPPIV
jgi:hypothetical protein